MTITLPVWGIVLIIYVLSTIILMISAKHGSGWGKGMNEALLWLGMTGCLIVYLITHFFHI